jgi:hypothetical protein
MRRTPTAATRFASTTDFAPTPGINPPHEDIEESVFQTLSDQHQNADFDGTKTLSSMKYGSFFYCKSFRARRCGSLGVDSCLFLGLSATPLLPFGSLRS